MRSRALKICIVMMCVYMAWIAPPAQAYDIGVFYFPGWLTGSKFWKDLKGEPGSQSPGVAWPDREPLLGYDYPEETTSVAEKEIEWASSNGITFFAYDWYWYGSKPDTEHAQQAFLKARNRNKMKFCLLWANHFEAPRTMREFDDMVSYWINVYFKEPDYYRINGKPVLFIYSTDWLAKQASHIRLSIKAMLMRADDMAKTKGHQGIYFTATTNERPGDNLEARLLDNGFSAYTGWNYVVSRDTYRTADYNSMVDTYLDFYKAAEHTANVLPYIVSASPGYDERPWKGNAAVLRTDPTPEKFERMLFGARALLDAQRTGPKILMIEAWNEYAEGAVLSPTKKWKLRYLEAVRKVFLDQRTP